MDNSKIQWTDSTWNPWTGCKKVSSGCKFCYMYRDKERYGQDPSAVKRTSDDTFYAPLNWTEPRKIFTCSWSDVFIDEADEWRNDFWDVIRKTPHQTYQILTKRPERILDHLPPDWDEGWDNVWLGVSIESQKYMHRATTLAKIPCKTRFISAEPLIGELDITKDIDGQAVLDMFHWCIIGGESGNETGDYRYRECKQDWIEKIINDLKGSDVKVFVKQLGTHLSKALNCSDRHGGDISEWPKHLQIREFPSDKIPSMQAIIKYDAVEEDQSRLQRDADDSQADSKSVKQVQKKVYTGTELLAMNITKMPSLIDPILPEVGIVALIGTSDIGKSTFLLQLCCDVVLHNSFLGFPINAKHKRSIFVSTEDDSHSLSYRLQRLKGPDEQHLGNMRSVFDTDDLLQTLRNELRRQPADLVVVDTFTDIYTGEMNQVNKVRSFMNDYYNLAHKHRCLIVFNHHTGKYTEEKPPSKNNSIGSQGFEGKSRVVMELRKDYKDGSKRHLCIVKGNYLPEEEKNKSYELHFTPEKGFVKTGIRKDFNDLVKPKLFKPFANREVEKDIVMRLHKKNRSTRQIEAVMKRLGHKVSKSTVAEWTKVLSTQEKP